MTSGDLSDLKNRGSGKEVSKVVQRPDPVKRIALGTLPLFIYYVFHPFPRGGTKRNEKCGIMLPSGTAHHVGVARGSETSAVMPRGNVEGPF